MLERMCLEVLPNAVSRSTSTESCLPFAEAGLLKDAEIHSLAKRITGRGTEAQKLGPTRTAAGCGLRGTTSTALSRGTCEPCTQYTYLIR